MLETEITLIPIQEEALSDPALRIFHSLSEPQLLHYYEPEPGIFIAESLKVTERALAAGYEPLSLVLEDSWIEKEERTVQVSPLLHACSGIPVYTAPASVLSQITGYRLTGGVLCAMRRKPLLPVSRVLEGSTRIAVLERVTNPTNVGAIFRSAAALSFDAVLLTQDCCDPYARRSSRVSMGTVFQIPWTRIPLPSGSTLPGLLREQGFFTVAMALCEDAVPLDDASLTGVPRLAVLLGSEGDGLCEETIRGCDRRVIIPMADGVDSLNVAAASAVTFWQLRLRSRQTCT